MNQPENNVPVINAEGKTDVDFLANGDWYIDFQFLDATVQSPTASEDIPFIGTKHVRWYQYKSEIPVETEAEAKEKNIATHEQLNCGVLRLTEDGQHLTINMNRLDKTPPQRIPQQKPRSNIKLHPNLQLPILNKAKKLGPNDPCSCGSGKKFKKCCQHKQFIK